MTCPLWGVTEFRAEESKSLLVLGEPGSGKTQAVDWCLQKLREDGLNFALFFETRCVPWSFHRRTTPSSRYVLVATLALSSGWLLFAAVPSSLYGLLSLADVSPVDASSLTGCLCLEHRVPATPGAADRGTADDHPAKRIFRGIHGVVPLHP